MKKRNTPTEFPFEVWANDQADLFADDAGTFDDNWIVSASDLFGTLELPADDALSYYNEAA